MASMGSAIDQSETVFDLLEEALADVDLLATGLGEGLQRLTLVFIKRVGRDHLDGHEQVTRASTAEAGHPLAAESELLAALGALGDLHLLRAVESRDLDGVAEDRLREGDRVVVVEIVAVPLEGVVLGDLDVDQQVAVRPAVLAGGSLAVHPEGLARLDPRRDFDSERDAVLLDPIAATGAAGRVGGLAV